VHANIALSLNPMLMPFSRRWRHGVLLVLFTFAWFSNLQFAHLVKPDEGRYAEIPREMAATGDWLTPRLNNIKYFEKPALQYWATAAAFKVFGEHEWTARLWPAVLGYLGVLLAFFAGRRVFGEQAGLYSALILGSSFLWVFIGHIATLDMGLSFFMMVALAGFLVAQTHSCACTARTAMLSAWSAMALAVLSKGLVGIILPGAVLVVYSLVQRDFSLWRRLHIAAGLALFLLISAPWFIAVSLANPEFAQFFFIHEHFARFLTKVHGRFHPWYTFIPILALGLMPWLLSFTPAMLQGWRAHAVEKTFQPRRFLWLWAVVIFLFFSVSDSKLPPYILPIFPALAWLMGDYLTRISVRALRWQLLVTFLLGVIVTAGIVIKYGDFPDAVTPAPLYAAYAPWLIAAAGIWLAGVMLAIGFCQRQRVEAAVISVAVVGLISTQLILAGHDALSPSSSSYDFAQQLKPQLTSKTPFYCLQMYDQTLPFYLQRTCTLVAIQDEMAFGLEQEPKKWIPTEAEFLANRAQLRGAVVLMPPEKYDQLIAQHVPLKLLVRDTRRVAASLE
jgi:4-amino-4-deoxy-L-arabinose transferase-like glycosyltransferase